MQRLRLTFFFALMAIGPSALAQKPIPYETITSGFRWAEVDLKGQSVSWGQAMRRPSDNRSVIESWRWMTSDPDAQPRPTPPVGVRGKLYFASTTEVLTYTRTVGDEDELFEFDATQRFSQKFWDLPLCQNDKGLAVAPPKESFDLGDRQLLETLATALSDDVGRVPELLREVQVRAKRASDIELFVGLTHSEVAGDLNATWKVGYCFGDTKDPQAVMANVQGPGENRMLLGRAGPGATPESQLWWRRSPAGESWISFSVFASAELGEGTLQSNAGGLRPAGVEAEELPKLTMRIDPEVRVPTSFHPEDMTLGKEVKFSPAPKKKRTGFELSPSGRLTLDGKKGTLLAVPEEFAPWRAELLDAITSRRRITSDFGQ